jgi:hypothetical protein
MLISVCYEKTGNASAMVNVQRCRELKNRKLLYFMCLISVFIMYQYKFHVVIFLYRLSIVLITEKGRFPSHVISDKTESPVFVEILYFAKTFHSIIYLSVAHLRQPHYAFQYPKPSVCR